MKLTFIEFQRTGLRPFSAHDGETQYDVEYCERDDQLHYDESGTGSPYLERRDNLWWAVDGVHPDIIDEEGERQPAPIKNRIELPQKYCDEIDDWAYYGRTGFCNVCQDFVPLDDLCEHIEWDDEEGEWVQKDTSGENEKCLKKTGR